MKNTFRSPLLLAIALLFGMGIFVTQFSLAEEPEDQVVLLQDQMQQLIQAQLELTQALKGQAPADQGQNDFLPESQQAGGDGTNFPPSYICTSDYLEWPSSDTYKESDDWAIEDIYPLQAITGQKTGNFMDINGDGLTDYLFINAGNEVRQTCVQLNTGRGWELVHKCYARSNNNVWTFYGDCAQT